MILAHAANPDGSNFRKGQGSDQEHGFLIVRDLALIGEDGPEPCLLRVISCRDEHSAARQLYPR
jgi:hypothetical protein